LDRLARDKPSIWGKKGLYAGVTFLYVVIFALFLKQVVNIFSPKG